MAREPSPEIDDELFNEVYGKAYSGPGTSAANTVAPKVNDEKRPLTCDKSDDEDEAPDPNAVPTDFTSREAKVWEAKAKATERNWKKRKEEEMICKICGDPGHFTQVLFFLLKLQIAWKHVEIGMRWTYKNDWCLLYIRATSNFISNGILILWN